MEDPKLKNIINISNQRLSEYINKRIDNSIFLNSSQMKAKPKITWNDKPQDSAVFDSYFSGTNSQAKAGV